MYFILKIPVGRRLNRFALADDRFSYAAYNQGMSDSSLVLKASTRLFSLRDSGSVGYLSLISDGYERNDYPKLYKNKPKKFFIPSNGHSPIVSYNRRPLGKRGSVHLWSSPEWPSLHNQRDEFQRHKFEQLDPSEVDEFRLRDASSAARHAAIIAKMKRENSQRMLCRADLALHKAVSAIMTAEAVKSSYREPNSE